MKKIILLLLLLSGMCIAMTFSKPAIKECIVCSGLIKENVLRSGNTIGAKYWTDGKREAPMLPNKQELVKCPHCKALIWISEQKKTNNVNLKKNYKKIKDYIVVKQQDYFLELKKNDLDKEKEKYLRIQAWWTGNDMRRDIKVTNSNALTTEEKENMMLLYEMLDNNNRIMMIEIKRELGQFKEAEKLLTEPFPYMSDRFKKVIFTIEELIRQKNSVVTEIKFD